MSSFQTHDDKVQKKFAQSCSITGGGAGPPPPPGIICSMEMGRNVINNVIDYDGDLFDDEDMMNDTGVILDPTLTPFNALTKPRNKRVRVLMPSQLVEEEEIISNTLPSTPSCRERTGSPSPASLPGQGTTRTSSPSPACAPPRPFPLMNDGFESPRRSASPGFFSTRPRPSSGLESPATSRGSLVVDTEEILITNTSTGERRTVPPEYGTQDSNNNAKAKKGKAANKKVRPHLVLFTESFLKQFQDLTNAGAEYYTEMLVKQTGLMKVRMKLLKCKHKNEKMKQVLLRNQISVLGIDMEPSSESSSDSDDFCDNVDD